MSEVAFNTIAGGVLMFVFPPMVIALATLFREVLWLSRQAVENRKLVQLLSTELKF